MYCENWPKSHAKEKSFWVRDLIQQQRLRVQFGPKRTFWVRFLIKQRLFRLKGPLRPKMTILGKGSYKTSIVKAKRTALAQKDHFG